MDEYNTGMDPEVKRYFRKIIKSFSAGLLWLLAMAVLGLFLKMGYFPYGLDWYNGIFYFLFFASLAFLLRFFYKVWGKKE